MGARAQGAGGEVADPPGAGAEVASDRGATGANEPGVGGEATDPGPTPPTAPRRERASKEAPGPRLPVTAARRERTSQAPAERRRTRARARRRRRAGPAVGRDAGLRRALYRDAWPIGSKQARRQRSARLVGCFDVGTRAGLTKKSGDLLFPPGEEEEERGRMYSGISLGRCPPPRPDRDHCGGGDWHRRGGGG